MKTEIGAFVVKWLLYCLVLYLTHTYVFAHFFGEKELYFSLWSIYLFNAGLVLAVYLLVMYQVSRGHQKAYNTFLGLTILKMVLSIVFLSPLIAGKSTDAVTETINFFIPYFLLLIFEIFQLGKFLQAR